MAEIVLSFIAIVGGGTAGAVLLVWLYRRKVPHIMTAEDHQLAGHFLGTLSGFYGVLLAFVVVMVWGQFQDANVIATREANQIGDLYHLCHMLHEPAEARTTASLIEYEKVVITKEWPAMAHRGESKEAWAALENVWETFRGYNPRNAAELNAYEVALGRLADMSDARRLRLLAARGKVPGVFWALLILGAVITVLSTSIFRFKHGRPQLLMTGAIALLITFILFLVRDFDQPFSGAMRVRPEVFQRELQRKGIPVD